MNIPQLFGDERIIGSIKQDLVSLIVEAPIPRGCSLRPLSLSKAGMATGISCPKARLGSQEGPRNLGRLSMLILGPHPMHVGPDSRPYGRAIWQSWRRSCFGIAKRPLLNPGDILQIRRMALKRLDNIGIVVNDLGPTIDFFQELGRELEGRATIEGEWAGRVTGLADQRVERPISH
jgi:hypothetical protein